MKTRERAEEERDEGGEGDLQRASLYCYAPVVFVLRRGDWGLDRFKVRRGKRKAVNSGFPYSLPLVQDEVQTERVVHVK